jgi:hypothetical protein
MTKTYVNLKPREFTSRIPGPRKPQNIKTRSGATNSAGAPSSSPGASCSPGRTPRVATEERGPVRAQRRIRRSRPTGLLGSRCERKMRPDMAEDSCEILAKRVQVTRGRRGMLQSLPRANGRLQWGARRAEVQRRAAEPQRSARDTK